MTVKSEINATFCSNQIRNGLPTSDVCFTQSECIENRFALTLQKAELGDELLGTFELRKTQFEILANCCSYKISGVRSASTNFYAE